MKENRELALKTTFGEEGGYSNDAHDKGGPTKFGITAHDLGTWRALRRDATVAEVRDLTAAEATEIMVKRYMDPVRFDDLPPGLDLCVFDYGINSGPAQATKSLQRVVQPVVGGLDGQLGASTLEAVGRYVGLNGLSKLIDAYQDERLRFLKALSDWKYFGKGWGTRVERVRKVALGMAVMPTRVVKGQTVKPPVVVLPPEPTPPAPPSNTAVTATAHGRAYIAVLATAVATGATDLVTKLGQFTSIKYVPEAMLVLTLAAGVAGIYLTAQNISSGTPR